MNLEDSYLERKKTRSFYSSSKSLVNSLVYFDDSLVSELVTSNKVVTSFYSHGVSFIEEIKDYVSQDTPLAFRSYRNFVFGVLWIILSV
jgi:hypothetical protein